jgi:6-pyruvoyltetrahydropterin/6-carboxytetrahydropterin synthase
MDCAINRRAKFSASHRYWLPTLTEAENQERFGLHSRLHGHGHNYVLFVTMPGVVDEAGMVLNLSDVKHVIREYVTEPLNLSFLNEAWPEFGQTLPTTEFIAYTIWQKLAPHLPLQSIVLYEDEELWAEYRGESMHAYLTVGSHFAAAHRLAREDWSYEHNCEIYGLCARPNGHGHNYGVEVTVRGEIDSETGMIVDLVKLQQVIDQQVLKPFDHTFLNKDVAYFAKTVPTAENIALHIAELLQAPVAALGCQLYRIKLTESPNNSCEVVLPIEAPQDRPARSETEAMLVG